MKALLQPAIIATVLAGSSAHTAGEEASYDFSKPIDTDQLEQEEIVAVPLDSDIYAATRDGFPDIRIRDGGGQEVPFALRKATETREETTRQRWRAEDVSLKPLDDGRLEIRLELDENDPQPDGLSLETPLENFEKRVQIFAGGENGRQLVSDALIFDYSQYMDVGNREIRLPETDHRRFRILIEDPTAEQQSQIVELTRRLRGDEVAERIERSMVRRRPLRIDRIEFWQEQTRQRVQGDRKQAYPVESFEVSEISQEQQTHIDIQTQRQPLTAFTLETSSRNFHRRAVVEVPETQGVRTNWRAIGEATISRIDFRDLHREELTITFPEQRRRRYRIVIHNSDSPPLKIEGINAEGKVYRLVFLAAPESHYRIAYGSEAVESPQYDMAAVLDPLTGDYEPVTIQPGEQIPNPAARPPALGFRSVMNNRFVLGGAICLLAGLLAWGLYKAAGRVDQLPGE